MKVVIYTLADPRTNEVRYVGKTISPKTRLVAHLRPSYRGPKMKENWILDLRRRGLTPKMEVLERSTVSSWRESERFWIEYLRFIGCKLCNISHGGGGDQKNKERGLRYRVACQRVIRLFASQNEANQWPEADAFPFNFLRNRIRG